MFKATNPYDDIVNKATDETLTSEDWGVIITLCDKVNDEGEQGAQNVVVALLKRLTHRNANVQLYSLALADALVKNCKIELHREISSRAFTAGMERLVSDRTTHDKVKKRGLALIKEWAYDFKDNGDLGLMDELYQSLKARHYNFESPEEPPPLHVDDEIRRREEEELQRALEMSVHETRGNGRYGNALDVGSSSGAGGSGSGSSSKPVQDTTPKAHTSRMSSYAATTSGGARSPSPKPAYSSGPLNGSAATFSYPAAPAPAAAVPTPTPAVPVQALPIVAPTPPPPAPVSKDAPISRVRALHTFEPTGRGELAFEKGDVIKVVDRAFKDWWRGQLRGKTGIFPVNYVELIPDPTPLELQREAEVEAQVFAQAANIDRLLSMLRGLDPSKDNLADNEDIQELYRQTLSLRPKIVKLIDRYTQKKDELMGMNESFLKARKLFDRMMEESLAVHNPGVSLYDYTRAQQQAYTYDPRQSTYGYPGQTGYNGYPPEGYPADGQYGQQHQGYPSQGYDPRAYETGGYPPGTQQPSYDQYTQQQAYQYNQQAQPQPAPPDGRAQQYADNQQHADNQQQPAYGQSPYPQGLPGTYPDQAPQSAYPSQPADRAQYPDENARLWAEYYAAQGRAQEGQSQSGVPPAGQLQPVTDGQAPQQQLQPQDPAQYPPQQPPYGPTSAHPGFQPTSSYQVAPLSAPPQPQVPASSSGTAAPAAQPGSYPQQQQSYPGYEQQPRQDALQPPYGMPPAGSPVRQGSLSQAQANRQSMVSPPAHPPYSPGPRVQDVGQYPSQYASMHQGFVNMGVTDPGPPQAPVS